MLYNCLPQLQQYARSRNISVAMSSLQWGLADAAVDVHDAVDICLEEVDACRAASEDVFFLVSAKMHSVVDDNHEKERESEG